MKKTVLTVALLAIATALFAVPIEPALVERVDKLDQGERVGVMIVLGEQLDAENIIQTIEDKQERWNHTVTTLKAMAGQTQVGLLAELRAAGAGVRLALSPSANPFRGSVLLRFSLPQATATRLSVYDAAGRVVRRLVDTGSGTMAAGHYQVRWNGSDDAGRQVATGIYFYRLEIDSETIGRKAVVTR